MPAVGVDSGSGRHGSAEAGDRPAQVGRGRGSRVRVTGTGHAGMLIETGAGSILCDPWVNPAYFASWFPFPDNSVLDWERLGQADYVYLSHLHRGI